MTKVETFKLLYFITVASLGTLEFGFASVFSSPLLDDLQSRENFTQWTIGFQSCSYQALIGPLTPVGAIFGGLMSSPAMSALGIVESLVLGSSIYVVGWTLIGASFFVADPSTFRALILLGRTVTGIATGWSSSVVPVSSIKHILNVA